MTFISLIVPCYNEEESIEKYYSVAESVRKKDFPEDVAFQYVFVDDGSTDRTYQILKSLSEQDPNVKYISFSRNFGKEAAMLAGLEHATGDYAVIMDADLQDPPALLRQMYDSIVIEGFDKVATRRKTRKGEPIIRTLFAKLFYKLINAMSDVPMVSGARDYVMMTRKVVDSILALPEKRRYTKGIFNFIGYKTKWYEYENIQRVAGKTKWSFWGLFKYAIEGITSFSTVPLMAMSFIGFIGILISVGLLIPALILYSLAFGIASAVMFLAGTSFISCGMLGVYMAKMFTEIKNRPMYIVGETNIAKEEKIKESK